MAGPPRLGRVQYQIMQVLWQHGACTARQLTEEMSKAAPIAHSTVQTLLRQLEGKGAVAHDVEDRTFIYRPLLQPFDLTSTPLHELLTRVYQGSVYNLMSHLLKHEVIPADELARLRKLLDEEGSK
jgi:BlaI family transcriptional regulator, penicillinase repressor